MRNYKVSLPVIRRLPRYFRYLGELKSCGVKNISSGELAKMMGSTPSQVRQDFNCFGDFGQQGVGYSVDYLYGEIKNLLVPEKDLLAVLIGVGNLGVAVANFILKEGMGVKLVALFDDDKTIIGNHFHKMEILPVESLVDYCRENPVDIIIACTPKAAARKLAPAISRTGVRGVWNFTHFDFANCDKNLTVENVHLRDSLMALSYRLTHSEGKDS